MFVQNLEILNTNLTMNESNKEFVDDIMELRACFESAIDYCHALEQSPEQNRSEIEWLIHDWDQKEHQGYNDSLTGLFERLQAYYEQVYEDSGQ